MWVAGGAVVLITALLVGPCVQRALQIDRCLDDGGRWNYDKNQCERARQ